MLRLWNTLSREKEPLPDRKELRLFVCGPTVNDYAHIGHARTYIFFDFLARYLRAQGRDVFYLQNITNIDDKIIRRAAEEGKKAADVADFFMEAYLADMAALGIGMSADGKEKAEKIIYAPATKFIPQIAAQVERLAQKGFAYRIEGDGWYFDIAKFAGYGKLSGRTALQAEDSVSRIDESVGKRNKGDFCLWKFSKPGEPEWPAPQIGAGRPGWHIEDTAISEFYFGPQYEIHGGGVDLKFPHHEAEIAQQESASGKAPFVRIWMHTGALLVDGRKMSKSLGNFVTIRGFLEKYGANVLRWIAFTHHYRSPIDYTEESAAQAAHTLDGIASFLAKLGFLAEGARAGTAEPLKPLKEAEEKLEDDLNVPQALAGALAFASELQPALWNIPREEAAAALSQFRRFFGMFGFDFAPPPEIPENARKLAAERDEFRGNKQFDKADALRRKINGLGFDIEDTPKGPFLWPQPKNHS